MPNLLKNVYDGEITIDEQNAYGDIHPNYSYEQSN